MSFDLHVLSLPLAFILSQDQTLRSKNLKNLLLGEPHSIPQSFKEHISQPQLVGCFFSNPKWECKVKLKF